MTVKKVLLLIVAVFMSIMCLGSLFLLFVLVSIVDIQYKRVIAVVFSIMVVGFGLLALLCFVLTCYERKKPTGNGANVIASRNLAQGANARGTMGSRPTPQAAPNSMRGVYTVQQVTNDIRILKESMEIMERTTDVDTFLARYETAMRCALTLEQAKRAGAPITMAENFSQLLVVAKRDKLKNVLYRSFNKEVDAINNLKTESGKRNRINRYQEKLKSMYEDNFKFIADEAYNDIMDRLELMKKI